MYCFRITLISKKEVEADTDVDEEGGLRMIPLLDAKFLHFEAGLN
jgi:hypothetical protein